MSTFEEEQAEEIEVLKSIFPLELEIVPDTDLTTFKIHLTAQLTCLDQPQVSVCLMCCFPKEYPSCVPALRIEVLAGLGDQKTQELKELIDLFAMENVGTPSIFSVTEIVKTWLVAQFVSQPSSSNNVELVDHPKPQQSCKPKPRTSIRKEAEVVKRPFPTSEGLYNQVKNDPFIFKHKVSIGYHDRVKNMMKYKEFNKWTTIELGGDIPWHRVHYFMYERRIMWDRENRVCCWKEIHDANKGLNRLRAGPFSVLSLNVLNDRAKHSPFSQREAQLLDRLRAWLARGPDGAPGVDFILFQELDGEFLPRLARAVDEAGWHICSTAGTEDIEDHLAIITHLDIVDSDVFKLSRSKAFLQADVFTEDMQTVRVMNVHLTSNQQQNSASKRLDQLLEISKHSAGFPTVIAGDFNDRDVLTGNAAVPGFIDCVAVAPTGTDTSTFDPGMNALAKVSGGRKGALDKVLVSSASMDPVRYSVLRDVAVSDHFPLKVEVNLREDCSSAPWQQHQQQKPSHSGAGSVDVMSGHRTALVVIVPPEHWGHVLSMQTGPQAQAQARGAVPLGRWMPHLSLCLGWEPEADFFAVEPALQQVVCKYLPLRVELATFALFEHHSMCTVVMEINAEAKAQLRLLRNELTSVSARGSRYPLGPNADFNPHLTIEKCRSRVEAERVLRRLCGGAMGTGGGQGMVAGTGIGFSFVVDKLCMVSREGRENMVVVNTVGAPSNTARLELALGRHVGARRLMGSGLLDPDVAQDVDLQVQLLPSVASGRTVNAKGRGAQKVEGDDDVVHAIAGTQLDGKGKGKVWEDKGGDGDEGVCEGGERVENGDDGTRLSALLRDLEACGEALLVQLIQSDYGRCVQVLTKAAKCYDIHIKRSEGGLEPSGMELLMDKVAKLPPAQGSLFRSLVALIKERFQQCGVYGQKYGFVPGYGVAIMVYHALCDRVWASVDVSDPDKVAAAFATVYAQQELPIRVGHSLSQSQSRNFSDMSSRFMTIPNVCPPHTNILRTVTRSSLEKMRVCWLAGLCAKATADSLSMSHPHGACLVARTRSLRDWASARAWFSSSFLRLVLGLETAIGGPIIHSNDWEEEPPEPALDLGERAFYAFQHRFELRTAISLSSSSAVDAINALQAKFYSLFPEAALDVDMY